MRLKPSGRRQRRLILSPSFHNNRHRQTSSSPSSFLPSSYSVEMSPPRDCCWITRTGFDSATLTVLRPLVTAALLLAAVSFSCIVLYRAAGSAGFEFSLPAGTSSGVRYILNWDAMDTEEHKLERVLKDASMEDKTVILTTVNEAWIAPNSIVDLFLESFRIGHQTRPLLNHLVIIALDQKAFSRCLHLHTHCFALTTESVDFSKEAYFMTPDYLKMMWRRIDFLRSVLELGYNFVFTDADIMWFRNPFSHFSPDADFQIACDHFSGQSDDVQNRPNGGFNFVRSNNRSIEFYKFWYTSRETYPRLHDQDVLNKIKNDSIVKDIGVKMRFLDTAYFGGFCEPSKDLNEVCTMHANCCFGLESKVFDLKIMLQDWKKFMSLPPSMRRSEVSSWSVPQNCSLDSLRHYDPLGNEVQVVQLKEVQPPKEGEQPEEVPPPDEAGQLKEVQPTKEAEQVEVQLPKEAEQLKEVQPPKEAEQLKEVQPPKEVKQVNEDKNSTETANGD